MTISIVMEYMFPSIRIGRRKPRLSIEVEGNKVSVTDTLFDIRWYNAWILIEKHNRDYCTCSYCRGASIWDSCNRQKYGYSRPIDLTGWYRFHFCTKKSVFYLRFTSGRHRKDVKVFEKRLLKKYIPEEVRKLHDFLGNEMKDYRQKVEEDSMYGISHKMAVNMRVALKKKIDEMPLLISSSNKYIRAFAKWRLHIGK